MNHLALLVALALGACSHDPAGVRIAHETPVVTTPALAAKVEPVFYNGKTYQVSISPHGDGSMAMGISGMSAAQAKDAMALSTSTLHHFACKDSQKAVLQAPPAFDGRNWNSSGHCA
jgi:hypothetical protein